MDVKGDYEPPYMDVLTYLMEEEIINPSFFPTYLKIVNGH